MTTFTKNVEYIPPCSLCNKNDSKIFLTVEDDVKLKHELCCSCVRTIVKFYRFSDLEKEDERTDNILKQQGLIDPFGAFNPEEIDKAMHERIAVAEYATGAKLEGEHCPDPDCACNKEHPYDKYIKGDSK